MKNLWLEFNEKDSVILKEEEQSISLNPGEALVEGIVSVISPGTELSLLQNTIVPWSAKSNKPPYPAFPGYAMVGKVVQSTDEKALPTGARVITESPHRLYNVVKINNPGKLCVIPNGMKDADAALAPLAKISLSAPVALDVPTGCRVLVLGMGIIGYLAAQWYKTTQAAAVHGVDLNESRASFAKEHGIDVQPSEKLDSSYDIVVEATGSTKGLEQAFQCVRNGGAVVLLGTTRGKIPEFDFTNLVHRKNIAVVGAHVSRHGTNSILCYSKPVADPLKHSLQHIHDGKLNVNGLIGATFSPKNAKEAYKNIQDGKYYTAALEWTGK